MRRILTAAFFVLTLSAPALADTVPAGATVWMDRPTGDGKPDAVSCYWAVPLGTNIRHLLCARNSQWARMTPPACGVGCDYLSSTRDIRQQP